MNRQWERLVRQKETLKEGLTGWREAELRFQPSPAAWCALGVVDHVIKTEKAFTEEVTRYAQAKDKRKLGGPVMAMMVNLVMLSPMRIKVPKGAEMVLPGVTENLEDLLSAWDRERQEMRQALDGLNEEQLRRGVFHHPVSGWLTAEQGLNFLSAHLRHHEHQLKRLRRAA